MKVIAADTEKMLESLRREVSNALEKKKCLGQYAVMWDGEKPVVVNYSFSQVRDTKAE